MKLPFPLQQGEEVVLVTRRHWLYFVPRFIGYALTALLPAIVLLVVLGVAGKAKGTALTVAAIISAVWILLWLVRIALLKYRYDHDIWVVTNMRMVDLIANNPMNFHMSSADLVELEDVTTSRDGPLQSMFDYGNLECQTAGQVRHFTFRGVPDPRRIAALVERESLAAKGHAGRAPIDDTRTQRLP
ncbi:MAG: YdbT family protein [Dehalococcoidia bacterium]